MNAIHKHIREGRLIRHAWTGTDREGRATACLLAAISPAVAASKMPGDCPASLISPTLAHLTVFINDAGTSKNWPMVAQGFADLIDRTHVLGAAAWSRLDCEWRCIAVTEAMRHTTDAGILAACAGVIDALRSGEPDRIRASREAAWAAGAAATEAADRMIDAILDAWEAEIVRAEGE